jgi:UDPglucose 6-dehydrogenase
MQKKYNNRLADNLKTEYVAHQIAMYFRSPPNPFDDIKNNVDKNRLFFTTDIAEGIKEAEAIFIAVGTPPDEDGSADLKYVLAVARDIGKHLDHYAVVVTKSTVPIGTSEKVRAAVKEELEKRGADVEFDVASNPEFLKEGDAINDFMKPDRIVVGTDNDRAKDIMRRLYHPFVLNGHPILFMDIPSAEMTKYAANAMLATRISFMNDLAVLCEKVGADINWVRKGIGSDPRIGPKFLYAGTGYGGSCFPKDVKALIKTSEEHNHPLEILKAVENVNERQKSVLIDKMIHHFGSAEALKDKTFAVWGLSFKPNTDDMREAPSIVIINRLLDLGAKVKAYDPVAMEEAKRIFGEDKIYFAKDQYDAANNADGLLIVTEWNEFRLPDFKKLKDIMNENLIFDGRNIFELDMMKNKGFVYHSIGRKIIYG